MSTAGDCLYRLSVRLHLRREMSPETGRLLEALSMRDFGVNLYRLRMRRENPQATDTEIEAMVWAWLQEPPRPPFLTPPPAEGEHHED